VASARFGVIKSIWSCQGAPNFLMALPIHEVLNSSPPWLIFNVTHTHDSLTSLKNIDLWCAAYFSSQKHDIWELKSNKQSFIDVILHDYQFECLTLRVLDNETIFTQCQKMGSNISASAPWYVLIVQFFKSAYGVIVACALCRSPWPAQQNLKMTFTWIWSDCTMI
jgi:hypothetical protein